MGLDITKNIVKITYGGETVNLVGASEPSLTVSLPIELQNASAFYTFQVSDDRILCSIEVNGSWGIWLYVISADEWIQLYSVSRKWQYFQLLPDGNCLITTSATSGLPNPGVLLYNAAENTITQVYDATSAWQYFQVLPNGNCLIGGGNTDNAGILLYDAQTLTVTQKYAYGKSWRYFKVTHNNKCFIGSSEYNTGELGTNYYTRYLIYDITGDTFKANQAGSNKVAIKYFHELSNGDYLISGQAHYNNDTECGIYLCQSPFSGVIKKYSNHDLWMYFIELPNGDCLLGSNHSDSGIVIYQQSTKTITQLHDEGMGWCAYHQVLPNGDCLIASGDSLMSDSAGIMLYDSSNNTITRIFDRGLKWKNFKELPNGKWLITSEDTTLPALIYDQFTHEIIAYSYTINGVK